MNGLVRRVADGAYRISLGCLLGLALEAFSLASQVHSCLHIARSMVGQNKKFCMHARHRVGVIFQAGLQKHIVHLCGCTYVLTYLVLPKV